MAILEIPLRRDVFAYQQRMDLDDVTAILHIHFNTRLGIWMFGIADANGDDLVRGIPMQHDIPLTDRFIGRIEGLPPGKFITIDETGQARDPDRENFGVEVKLFYEEANA